MKKFLLFGALISLVACSQVDTNVTDIPLGGTNITLGLPNTRTSLGEKEGDTYPIYWSEEDKIVVNGAVSSSVIIDKNRKSATFNFANDILSYPYCITYPYTTESSCAEGAPTVVFAAEQHFVEGTFGVGAAPMCGYCESGGSTSLKHLAGVLQLAIKGSSKLADIEISAADGVALAGEFGVDCQSGAISAIEGKVANKLTYFVNQTLSTTDATVCHIVVPAGNLGACKVLLTANNGEQMILKWNASDVKAGVVREFKEFTFKPGTMLELEGLPSEEDDLVIIPPTPRPANNEIWYTSSNGEVVMPYSGEYNEYADALTTFGANIVSNTYENGKGIIKFDSDVTSIGVSAFDSCTSLTSITIPDGVTSIGDYAFWFTSLESVIIGNGVASIGQWAFSYCTSLTSIALPDSITSIGDLAFQECCSLTSITIPISITSIGNSAFGSCSSLTSVYYKGDLSAWCKISFGGYDANPLNNGAKLYLNGVEVTNITIPSDITKIKGHTFEGCKSLTSVTIPDSVTSIEGFAFHICKSLTNVTIGNSVTSIGAYAFNHCTSLTSVTIGSGVVSIGQWAFSNCGLTSIIIPNSVTSIGNGTFEGCRSLTSITIPNSVTSIGYTTFSDCENLTSVTIPDSVTSIGYGAFRYCTSLTSVTIPDSVTSIGEYAFIDCTSLTSITIPNGVTSIGECAFSDCTSLTSITIPDSVTSIGVCAFVYCTSLTSFYGKFASSDNRCLIIDGVLNAFAIGCGSTEYVIPDSVISIRAAAFSGCNSLTSITIPESVSSIGDSAFYDCFSLKCVYCKPITPPTVGGIYMFDNNASGRKIYVPTASVGIYKSARYWSDYASDIVGYDF